MVDGVCGSRKFIVENDHVFEASADLYRHLKSFRCSRLHCTLSLLRSTKFPKPLLAQSRTRAPT